MRNQDTLPVAEIFGPTWQGEGNHAGRTAVFIRLGHCNLDCSWCDTPETWDRNRFNLKQTCPDVASASIIDTINRHPETELLVVTGGEPLIWQKTTAFHTVLKSASCTREIHVETNGTLTPTRETLDTVEWFTVSPKLSSSGVPKPRRIKDAALKEFSLLAWEEGRAVFKFVASDNADIDEITSLAEQFKIPPSSVWVMPEGTTPEAVIANHRTIAPEALRRGYNTTTRLHTLIWGNEKGH